MKSYVGNFRNFYGYTVAFPKANAYNMSARKSYIGGDGKRAYLKYNDMPNYSLGGYLLETNIGYPGDSGFTVTKGGKNPYLTLKEGKRCKNSDIVAVPFTISVTVPANTLYYVQYNADMNMNRNSEGDTGYYMEFFKISLWDWSTTDLRFITSDTDTPSERSVGYWNGFDNCRPYSNSSSAFSDNIMFSGLYRNEEKTERTFTDQLLLLVGVGESSSALNEWHHQLEAKVTFRSAMYMHKPLATKPAVVDGNVTEYTYMTAAVRLDGPSILDLAEDAIHKPFDVVSEP